MTKTPKTVDPARTMLIDRIEEAWHVIGRLPDADRKYRFPRLSSWPLLVRDMVEAYGWNGVRLALPPPSPASIDRADEVLAWFATHLHDYPKGAKALWLTYGRGLSLQQAGLVLHQTKTSVRRQREAALTLLLSRLAEQKAA